MTDRRKPSDSNSSLGDFLRTERERLGLSLEQIAAETKIHIRLLQAIEADHYDDFPAVPFLRGFITAYCNTIHVDARQVLLHYEAVFEKVSKIHDDKSKRYSGFAFDKREEAPNRRMLWVTMGSIAVIGGLLFAVFKPKFHKSKHQQIDVLKQAEVDMKNKTALLAMASPSPSSSTLGSELAAAVMSASPLPSVASGVSVHEGSKEVMASISPVVFRSPLVSVSPSVATSSPLAVSNFKSPEPATSQNVHIVAKPSPSAKPAAKPSVKPSVSPAAKPSIGVVTGESGVPRKADPLHSGADLIPSEVKHKYVFKSLSDQWVRYRVDDKQVNRIILREGRSLVLRAQNQIAVQFSNPENVSVVADGKSYSNFLKLPKNKQVLGAQTHLISGTETNSPDENVFGSDARPLPKEVPASPGTSDRAKSESSPNPNSNQSPE